MVIIFHQRDKMHLKFHYNNDMVIKETPNLPIRHQNNKNSFSLKSQTSRMFLFYLYLQLALLIPNNNVITTEAHLQSTTEDHRCSHVPPTPEQVHHVWLGDSNFSTMDGRAMATDGFTVGPSGEEELEFREPARAAKSKRQIRLNLLDSHHSSGTTTTTGTSNNNIQNSFWNLWRTFEKPPMQKTELVPMKIHVHYDTSVSLLEKRKHELIKGTVMPAVVKFFEDVLSIRRDYTIDRFRIARRCPNNTIYYAKDSIGLSKPYCMERCEDHAICGEMIVPREHLSACSYCNITSRRCSTNYTSEGPGVANTQLLLYVSAKQTVRCRKDQTIAYAAHCAQDTKTDRPVAGHANLCPASISTDTKDLKALIATVKHELTHVLGFSVSLFAYYRDELGRPLTERESSPGPIPVDPKTGYARWSDKVIKRYIRRNWVTGEGLVDKEANLIVTPTVVREVRAHFNCSTLEGAELEDQGSDGTSMTHWEKRLFENEAMTGTHTQNSVYSRITLAVLQDTGWYVANFTRAEPLEWGKDLGCDFAKKSCKAWIDERRSKRMSIRPFCDRIKGDLLQIACTGDRSSKAVCNMRHYSEPLPMIYQNFDTLDGLSNEQELAHYGGSVDLADYCPFIQEFTWQAQNVTVRGSRCDLGGGTGSYTASTPNGPGPEPERNAALEHYGQEARCFEHGRRWEQRSCVYKRHWHHYGAGCYRYTCSNGLVNVIVANHSYPCYYPDQHIHIEQVVDQWLYNGTLVCPECDKVCPANKCIAYDKRLIDKILSYAQDPLFQTNRSHQIANELIQSILDETFNLIDPKSIDEASIVNVKTMAKLTGEAYPTNGGSFGNSSTNISDSGVSTTSNLHPNHRQNLINIFREYQRPPKQHLLCSSAMSVKGHFQNLMVPFALLISSLIMTLLQKNIPFTM